MQEKKRRKNDFEEVIVKTVPREKKRKWLNCCFLLCVRHIGQKNSHQLLHYVQDNRTCFKSMSVIYKLGLESDWGERCDDSNIKM